MALTPSGTISLGDINTATGKSATAPISMSGTAVRCISGTTLLTAVSMSQLRNKNCAGGTITAGTRTVSGKSGTNTSNGYTSNASVIYGSITPGNITTFYPNATSIETLSSSQTNGTGNFANTFNVRGTSSAGFGNVVNIQVGDNNRLSLNLVTFVTPSGPAVYTLSSPNPLVAAADVGATRDWVITQV